MQNMYSTNVNFFRLTGLLVGKCKLGTCIDDVKYLLPVKFRQFPFRSCSGDVAKVFKICVSSNPSGKQATQSRGANQKVNFLWSRPS